MEFVELTVKLTVAQINMILAHLAKGAYAEVADIIATLHSQAKPQFEAAQEQMAAAENDSASPKQ